MLFDLNTFLYVCAKLIQYSVRMTDSLLDPFITFLNLAHLRFGEKVSRTYQVLVKFASLCNRPPNGHSKYSFAYDIYL